MAKFATNSSGAIWWSNLELVQVEPPSAEEITQVRDALPWVRCASGNVSLKIRVFLGTFPYPNCLIFLDQNIDGAVSLTRSGSST